MEIDKLIKRLKSLHNTLKEEGEQKCSPEINTVAFVLMDAASALSTLQAKNESLRAELAQADREGRCVVLPAKPDQIIYQWRKGDDCLSVSRLDGVQVNADGEITYPIWNGYLIPEDFGKTVFLTREEAALWREQDG